MRSSSWRWAAAFVAAVVYLGGHTLSGRDGLVSYLGLQAKEQELSARLAELEARRARLEDEVARLSSPHANRDLIEERARLLINAARPGEVVLLLPSA